MNLKDAVRTAVIATNSYWPFSTINRYPYYVAINALTRLCSKQPQVKSVYLRSGLVERDWIPGLSDIDETVITDSAISSSEEFSFLRSFWRRFLDLKATFPMLGEVDVLNDRAIQSWARLGVPGYAVPRWRLLYGPHTAKPTYVSNCGRLARDCLNYALNYLYWYSRGYFAQRFYEHPEPRYLLVQDLGRLASKIFRCLASAPAIELGDIGEPAHWENEHEVCAAVVQAMERATAQILRREGTGETHETAWGAQFAEYPAIPGRRIDVGGSAAWTDAVDSIIFDFSERAYVVLKDNIDAMNLAACAAGLKQAFRSSPNVVTIMSRSTFAYTVRYYQPYEYFDLMRHRKLAFGTDPLARIAPPCKTAYSEFLVSQAPHLLAYPQSLKMHVAANDSSIAAAEMASTFKRALLLLLYLEHGLVAPTQEVMLRECGRYYPEQVATLRALGVSRISIPSREQFDIFRRMADNINDRLTALT